MASLTVYDKTGKEVDTLEIDPTELAPRINKQLLHDAVVMYQANLRHGAAKTKTRAEVSGSTKKMYRQKGTGNARAGSRRSGVRRGGGHIHAKQPRDYSYRLPRKALVLATRMAIASKIRDDEIVLIDELSMAEPKTREMVAVIKALGCDGKSLLVATDEHNVNVYKSVRNIENVRISQVSDLNALSVLWPRRVLMTKASLEAVRAKAAADLQAKRSASGQSEAESAS